MNLQDLKRGQKAIVSGVSGQGPLTLRLMEMGFTPGTVVELADVARGGNPLLIRLRGYTLTLTRREAQKVSVRIQEERS